MAKFDNRHMLVKWKDELRWDILPLKDIIDQQRAALIYYDDEPFINTIVRVNWEGVSTKAILLATGKSKNLEAQKLQLPDFKKLIRGSNKPNSDSQHSSTYFICTPQYQMVQQSKVKEEPMESQSEKKDFKPKYAQLKSAETQLERERSRQSWEHKKGKKSEISKSFKVRTSFEADGIPSTSRPSSLMGSQDFNEDEMVDISNGVEIPRETLMKIIDRAGISGTICARALLKALFTDEEMVNKSLTGKLSNAFPDKPPKEQIDPKRTDAIIHYTSANYDLEPRVVRACLATFLTNLRPAGAPPKQIKKESVDTGSENTQ